MAEFDIGSMMKQAEKLQERLRELQESAAEKTVDAQAGGGMVKVTADGALRIRRITIDPAMLAANDQAMLEDLIVVAVNDALGRAQAMVAEEMSKLGPLAGLKLP
ncbi:MAG: YbaB/EbfC family nucleoid-associated protein [Candidatus Binataceae bacterium]